MKERHKMAGNKAGAKKAVATIKQKYGENFFARIGAEGGKKGRSGFTSSDSARAAGMIGGRKSFKGYKLIKKNKETGEYTYKNLKTGEEMVKFF